MDSAHGTLVADTVSTEDFTVGNADVVVHLRSGSGPIYFTVNGTDPEVEGSLSDQGKQNLVYSVAEPSFDPATAAARDRTIVPQMSIRLWLVEVDGFAPIAIFAVAAPGPPDTPDISSGWLDEFEATILPTIQLGPDGPPKPLS